MKEYKKRNHFYNSLLNNDLGYIESTFDMYLARVETNYGAEAKQDILNRVFNLVKEDPAELISDSEDEGP